MKTAVAILLFIVCCYSFPLKENEYQSLFTKWTVMHSKSYDVETFFKRYSIFKENLDFVNNHNAQNASYELEMNSFGDLTAQEFKESNTNSGLFPPSDSDEIPPLIIPSPSPEELGADSSLDWRNRKAVNAIQSQGGCGSCYAFSAISAVEGAWAIKKSTLIKLSEQQIVDCSRVGSDQGCRGGWMTNSFQYIINNKGISSSSKYPYAGKDQKCRSVQSVATISKFATVQKGNENALMNAVKIGPVSIAIEGGTRAFQFYSKGVLDDSSCGVKLDHGVTIVGYGTASGKPYWIVRNSWGNWGEAGYVRMVRNKNQCGLALFPSYPIV